MQQGGAALRSFLFPPAPSGPNGDSEAGTQAVPSRGHQLGWKCCAKHLPVAAETFGVSRQQPQEKKKKTTTKKRKIILMKLCGSSAHHTCTTALSIALPFAAAVTVTMRVQGYRAVDWILQQPDTGF